MRILVAGNTGYMGSHAAEQLAEARNGGHEIIGLDTGYRRDSFMRPPSPPGKQIFADIRDLSELPPGIDVVIDFASLSGYKIGAMFPEAMSSTGYDGAVNLANLARDAGVRLYIYGSTTAFYGNAGLRAVKEDDPIPEQTSVYGQAKIAAERAVLAMSTERFPVVAFRFPTGYGLTAYPRLELVVHDLILSGMVDGELRLSSDGTPWRPLIHADDVVRALLGALKLPPAHFAGKAYNVGSDAEHYEIRKIAAIVAEAMGNIPLHLGTETPAQTASYCIDTTAFRTTFPDFVPQKNLRGRIAGLVAEFRRSFAPGDYRGAGGFRYNPEVWIEQLVKLGRLGPDLRWLDQGRYLSQSARAQAAQPQATRTRGHLRA